MSRLNHNQQKAILKSAIYTLTTDGHLLYGKVIGYDTDHRGFGAIVAFRNGTRIFWGVNPRTLKVQNLGIAPDPRRPTQRTYRAIVPTFWR
jgi:hypothetical protein